MFRSGDEKYNHLDESEVEKVEKAVEEKHTWAEVQRGALNATSNYDPVPVTCSQVKAEQHALESLAKPILNKPKPKPKAPTPPPTEPEKPAEGNGEAAPEQEQAVPSGETPAPPPQEDQLNSMDVD